MRLNTSHKILPCSVIWRCSAVKLPEIYSWQLTSFSFQRKSGGEHHLSSLSSCCIASAVLRMKNNKEFLIVHLLWCLGIRCSLKHQHLNMPFRWFCIHLLCLLERRRWGVLSWARAWQIIHTSYAANSAVQYLILRKNFFTSRVAEHWKRFPRSSWSFPLCHLLQVALPWQQGMDWRVFTHPFQPQISSNSVVYLLPLQSTIILVFWG